MVLEGLRALGGPQTHNTMHRKMDLCLFTPTALPVFKLLGSALQLAPGRGLSVRIWPGIIQVSRSRVNAYYYLMLLCDLP